MLNAIRRQTIVKPGGIIELTLPELPEGAVVEVIVLFQDSSELAKDTAQSLTSLIGEAPGSFATPEEADQFIREQRDEWDY
ncbi:hypothetical protein GFS31_42020 (plasmid) [Leptolyngbya sp. BL0902]|uniref:hypothetical protein n=1 Tax=Leptolyngbya sp. BL0902 TaxID=1115757 RepID=UPI0018E77767|nr:hypothetical protein [Leptolyngbya sp. BL0902]QQE67489.1 hypothetical protein GFS31_42020 [Leptolyngbya sp. BL0902]